MLRHASRKYITSESVPDQWNAKLKRRKQKMVYSIKWLSAWLEAQEVWGLSLEVATIISETGVSPASKLPYDRNNVKISINLTEKR